MNHQRRYGWAHRCQVHQSDQLGRLVDLYVLTLAGLPFPNQLKCRIVVRIGSMAQITTRSWISPRPQTPRPSTQKARAQPRSPSPASRGGKKRGIIQSGYKESNQHSSSIPQTRSLLDFFMTHIKKEGFDEDTSKLVAQLARIWGNFVGDVIERQSLKYLWLEGCIEGGLVTPVLYDRGVIDKQ